MFNYFSHEASLCSVSPLNSSWKWYFRQAHRSYDFPITETMQRTMIAGQRSQNFSEGTPILLSMSQRGPPAQKVNRWFMKAKWIRFRISYLYLFSSNMFITLKTLIFSLEDSPYQFLELGNCLDWEWRQKKNYIWGFKYLLLWYSKAKFQVVPYFSEVPLTITGFQKNRKNQNEICSLAHNTFRKMLR